MAFVIVPLIGTGLGTDSLRPKYVSALPVSWSMVDHEDTCIVWLDATPAQLATIGANSDAWVVPPLDNLVDETAVETVLETNGIAAQWVMPGMTYRQVLRIVVGMSQLLQRAAGLGPKVQVRGTLNLTLGSLPANRRQALANASDSLGLDRSAVTMSTTVRAALRTLGRQFAEGRSITLGDL